MIQRIQIFGERCSGTNFLQQLVMKNLKGSEVVWEYGWKHFFHKPLDERARDCLFIVIYRNPFDWLSSLAINRYHAAPPLKSLGFSDFIRSPWWCVWGDGVSPEDPSYGKEMMFERDPRTGERFSNVIKMRAAKIANWESLRQKAEHTYYVRYEDLAQNPKRHIAQLSSQFQLRRTLLFRHVRGHMGFNFNARRYQPTVYDSICEDDIEFIVNELDESLEHAIGYSVDALAARLRDNCRTRQQQP